MATHPVLPYQPPDPRQRARTIRRWVWRCAGLAALAAGLVLTVAVVYVARLVSLQKDNIRRAREHIPVIQARINNDPRFAEVRMEEFTASNGSLHVYGTVPLQGDLNALNTIVRSTSPPVNVYWSVEVHGPVPATSQWSATTAQVEK